MLGRMTPSSFSGGGSAGFASAAAAVGVLVRFGLRSYLGSPFYRGHSHAPGDLPSPPGT